VSESMKNTKNTINNKKLIGIWGYPNPAVLEEIKAKYKNHDFIDLDVNYGAPVSNMLPDAYCKIIKNIIDNSLHLRERLELIIASVGEEKCNSAKISSRILKDIGFNVIETEYEIYDKVIAKTPISQCNLPLKTKIVTIMDNIIQAKEIKTEKCNPSFGFWGVPPNDADLLSLFPNETHVYGWVRCVEAKRPADSEMEMFVDEHVPTVFFAQTFCAKMQLAKYLAKKYDGMYVDADDFASNSVKAKITAFLRLG
jgi:hypothetical protein